MKQKKKTGFFTFLISFIPGAAEIYMGFTKNGFSIMALFFLSIMLSAATGGNLSLPLTFLIWAFGFFHARHLSGLDNEVFMELTDMYIWDELFGRSKVPEKTVRTCFAVLLILLGIGTIWSYISDIIFKLIPDDSWELIYPMIRSIPGLVFAVVLIVIGVLLIKGKKQELEAEDGE